MPLLVCVIRLELFIELSFSSKEGSASQVVFESAVNSRGPSQDEVRSELVLFTTVELHNVLNDVFHVRSHRGVV